MTQSCGKWMEQAKDPKVRGVIRMERCEHKQGRNCEIVYEPHWYECCICPHFSPRPEKEKK